MSELDIEALQATRDWVAAQLDAHDRRQRLAPLREAFAKRIELTNTEMIPDLMADATANTRKSILNLEKSFAETDAKIASAESEAQRLLASARRRTKALRRWLEDLS